ncbi:histidine phosphatase family protein [Sulfuricystis multivorans]|uniref:histidine phosphatase family protein n=1 Tax=Sulfuricystis multivorans TaxID=2211108 RepID=UPI000F8468B7|nr:histidine phosphatase family protein [Sulfuricystis multivorans]
MTRLCLIRHGETDWNAGRRIQGQLDIPLSALGHAQARATANALKDEGFAAIYSSDLARARQTAEATAHLAKVSLHLYPGVRERHYGIFQGLTYAECEARHPAAYARHKARDPRFVPEGGESLLDFAARLSAAIDAIVRRHPGEAVAIFTHGGVLDIVYRQATGRPLESPRDFTIPNCGINWIEIDAGCWTLLSWGEREHLERPLDEL